MEIEIREERPEDLPAIRALNQAAFGSEVEARLVDALRSRQALTLSLVGLEGGRIVGHIAFSPVRVESNGGAFEGMGLGPMAVDPAVQRRGIGGRLIAAGLQRLRDRACPFCVVLGHADYYPRHGFVRASKRGIQWEHPIPEELFFVQELSPGGLDGVSGVVRYRPEFDGV